MARLLVAVHDPLGLKAREDEAKVEAAREAALPLLLGALAQVELEGNRTANLAAVPRRALHDGSSVFVLSKAGTLDIRLIDIVWREPEQVFADLRLTPGERLITSTIASPVQGMALRDAATSEAASAKAAAAHSPGEGAAAERASGEEDP